MFTRWTISNFKSIREPVTLDLAPLTIFSGINSSGKSTLVQSLLMVAQSFISVVDDEALVLNGRFLHLGRLQDILHYGNGNQPMEIGFDWLPADEVRKPESLVIHVDALIEKENSRSFIGQRTPEERPYISQAKLAFAPIWQIREEDKFRMQVLEVHANNFNKTINADHMPLDLRDQVRNGIFNYRIVRPDSKHLVQDSRLEIAQGAALTNIIPTRLLVGVDAELAQLQADADWIIDLLDRLSSRPKPNPTESVTDTYLSPYISELFRLAANASQQLGKETEAFRHNIVVSPGRKTRGWVLRQLTSRLHSSFDLRRLRQHLASAQSEFLRDKALKSFDKSILTYEERLLPPEFLTPVNQIQRVFSEQIYYLGPLRDDPRVIYAQPPLSEQFSVGLKGEYTAAKLYEYGELVVDYPVPPEQNFFGHYRTERGRLIDGVILWLRRMGLVDAVSAEETPKIGFRLTVNSPGLKMPLDLTSVGVGISQVLPTLVLSLLTPLDSVLIFEQPELHLHPKVQSVLGDFLLAISLMGKQCLVETHSEHLINRLRRRIVESREKTVLPRLRIYFAEKEGTVSHFHQVKPNEFGSILEWPTGFFDEAENEAAIILKLQMEKRRQLKNQKQPSQGKEP